MTDLLCGSLGKQAIHLTLALIVRSSIAGYPTPGTTCLKARLLVG